MAAELNLNMRSDGYVKVQDLLKLNIQTFANIPLRSHTVDEIKEVSERSFSSQLFLDNFLRRMFNYLLFLTRLSERIISSASASWKKMGSF